MVGTITAELRQMYGYFVSDYETLYHAGVAYWVDASGMSLLPEPGATMGE